MVHQPINVDEWQQAVILYSRLTGVLAGFVFTLITIRLSEFWRDKTPMVAGVKNSAGVLEAFPVVFFALLVASLLYAEASGYRNPAVFCPIALGATYLFAAAGAQMMVGVSEMFRAKNLSTGVKTTNRVCIGVLVIAFVHSAITLKEVVLNDPIKPVLIVIVIGGLVLVGGCWLGMYFRRAGHHATRKVAIALLQHALLGLTVASALLSAYIMSRNSKLTSTDPNEAFADLCLLLLFLLLSMVLALSAAVLPSTQSDDT